MNGDRATLEEIATFLAPRGRDRLRAARGALERIGVTVRGRTVPWPVVLDALGLDRGIAGEALVELTRPLMSATDVAARHGVNPETIYRWHRQRRSDLPEPLSLGDRGLRWIRAEIEAWDGLRAPVSFPRTTRRHVPFGALTPRGRR